MALALAIHSLSCSSLFLQNYSLLQNKNSFDQEICLILQIPKFHFIGKEDCFSAICLLVCPSTRRSNTHIVKNLRWIRELNKRTIIYFDRKLFQVEVFKKIICVNSQVDIT